MLSDNLFTIRSGIGFVLLVSTIGIVCVTPFFSSIRYRRLVAITIGLLAFQGLHFLEHVIQLGYWFVHPLDKPYMTPWAHTGLEGLGLWATSIPGAGSMMLRGMELLHLVGNLIFLGGLLALRASHRRANGNGRLPGLRIATIAQTAHVLEHVLLTATVFIVGEPLGVSTLFGFAEGAAWARTVRVWFHFLINFAATAPALSALIRFLKQAGEARRGHVDARADVSKIRERAGSSEIPIW